MKDWTTGLLTMGLGGLLRFALAVLALIAIIILICWLSGDAVVVIEPPGG